MDKKSRVMIMSFALGWLESSSSYRDFIPKRIVYKKYVTYCKEHKVVPVDQIAFERALFGLVPNIKIGRSRAYDWAIVYRYVKLQEAEK